MSGILLIDKPRGFTSHDVVAKLRRRFNTKRIGHAGTLDPIATGLLVVAVGPATRVLRFMDLEPKEYEFTVQFGVETDSFDSDGEVVAETPVPQDLDSRIRTSLIDFFGEIKQVPPMYSAVKVEGKPLYKYARKGEEVEREPREVTIYSLEIVGVGGSPGQVVFRCICSGGTYVRTIAHDLGQRVGCGAHVVQLRRTGVGRFRLADAATIDEAAPSDFVSIAEALEPMPVIRLKDGQARIIQHGNTLRYDNAPNEVFVALADEDGRVFSIARVVENELHPECVLPLEALDGAV